MKKKALISLCIFILLLGCSKSLRKPDIPLYIGDLWQILYCNIKIGNIYFDAYLCKNLETGKYWICWVNMEGIVYRTDFKYKGKGFKILTYTRKVGLLEYNFDELVDKILKIIEVEI